MSSASLTDARTFAEQLLIEGSQIIECQHCATPIAGTPILGHTGAAEGKPFCCHACEAVFLLLNQEGLTQYYGIARASRRQPLPPTTSAPLSQNHDPYAHWDDPDFIAHTLKGGNILELYVEGVHCAACVWLIERLPTLTPSARSASLDLGRSLAHIDLAPGASLADIGRTIHRLGYRPHAITANEQQELQRKENRRWLLRIGVAAASTMNVMTMAVALYSGAAGAWAHVFQWGSLLFYLPVFFYAATPFYRSAWSSLKTHRLSIDVPIVLGICLGTLEGTWNLFSGAYPDEIYFDSLAMLVFLLLSARFLVRAAQQRATTQTNFARQLMPASARRWNASDGRFESVPLERIRPGDRIQVRPGEMVPADGQVLNGNSQLDCAVLTGESHPIPVACGDRVDSGAVNVASPLELEVTQSGSASRLGQLVALVREAATRRSPAAALADRIAGKFTLTVLLLGAVIFAVWAPVDPYAAFNHAMALFIVTCPCALAMSAPVAVLVSMSRLAQRGIVVKGADVLEKIAQADTIFLDKTGTLTEGKLVLARIEVVDASVDQQEMREAILALETASSHPVAEAICDSLRRAGVAPRMEATRVHERIGFGIAGDYAGHRYQIGRPPRDRVATAGGAHTVIWVERDGMPVACLYLQDRLRTDAKECVVALRSYGLAVHLLSGDSSTAVTAVSQALGITQSAVHAECTPHAKLQMVGQTPRAIMVGDGANDAASLARAFVGVAVHGGMEVSLKAADVFLTQPGIAHLVTLIRGARETAAVIRRNLVFSAFYNLVGAGMAAAGLMSPLMAAVLMPLSSFTILTSSWLGARSLR